MSNWILGIHFGHDASATLVKDGTVIAAIEEERLARIKCFAGFPYNAIYEVLAIAGIKPSDIETIAIPGLYIDQELPYPIFLKRIRCLSKFGNLRFKGAMVLTYLFNSNSARRQFYPPGVLMSRLSEELRRLGFTNAQLRNYDHHLCHAASAYFPSPFSKAVVFTMDGCGDFCSAAMFSAENNSIKVISRIPDIASIGQFYSAVTRFLGFRPNRHEGKVTGLAAVGNPEPLSSSFRNLIVFGSNGESPEIFFRELPGMAYPPENTTLDALNDCQIDLKKKILVSANSERNIPYEVAAELFQKWLKEICNGYTSEDIAAAAQQVTEEWITEWIKKNLQKEDQDICLAGGVFANVKVNQRIRELPGVKNIYVQPAMGDNGLSLGAALLAWSDYYGEKNKGDKIPLRHVYLGSRFGDDAIENVLKRWPSAIRWERFDHVEKHIAKHVYEGKIVGRFNGPLEWGPRALGNRSILVRPTDKTINDTLNKRLRRSEFMPFAPSVLDYRAKDYFIGYKDDHIAADFMTVTYDVYPEKVKEIEAVVHVDNTARPQIVRKETNPSFYKILQEYERLSGIGLMVNTSFNMHEEPIVASPEDALRALDKRAVDILAIGSFLVYLEHNSQRSRS